jgi:hypothetical protein
LSCVQSHHPNNLELLVNYLSTTVYKSISECSTFEQAIQTLQSLYVPSKSEIFARHLLHTCKQENGQSLDQYIQKLRSLATDCNYETVSAAVRRDEAIRDTFVTGIQSNQIRQRLLEYTALPLSEAIEKAKALETAYKQSLSYQMVSSPNVCSIVPPDQRSPCDTDEGHTLAAVGTKCFFCGYSRHPRTVCPAREALCKLCGKMGHFQKVCRSGASRKPAASVSKPILSTVTVAAAPVCLKNAVIDVIVNGISLCALVDTGSSESYISASIIRKHKWKTYSSNSLVSMANIQCTSNTLGHCIVQIRFKNSIYDNVKLSILSHLCADVLLGHDFLNLHQRLEMPFGGNRPTISLCNLTAAQVPLPILFENLSPDCKPIATKSMRHSPLDEAFIRGEIQRLLRDNIIEPSSSPWRAQVLVTTNDNHKRRMVVDYSQTINRFTYLDAYPLPRIGELVEKISHYEFYSALDLRNAYHQIPIRKEEQKYTAFEACGNLYQFCRIPFGVTNGVACFQRTINELINIEKLVDTYTYVDNVAICGNSKAEHDANLSKFMEAARKYGLTFNEDKSTIGVEVIRMLGYEISKGTILSLIHI